MSKTCGGCKYFKLNNTLKDSHPCKHTLGICNAPLPMCIADPYPDIVHSTSDAVDCELHTESTYK